MQRNTEVGLFTKPSHLNPEFRKAYKMSLRGPPWRDRLKTGGGFINNPGLGQGLLRYRSQ